MKIHKCNYCRKRIFLFPINPQGRTTKYHSKCFDEYTGNMLQFAMERAIKTGKGMLIPI